METPENEWPLNVYGYSKLEFDRYVRRLLPAAESTVVGLRYFNVYGHGEAHKGRMASMVYHFARQVRETGVARLFGAFGDFGPGESTRDFVSVDDLVELNLFFLQRGGKTIVNAGTGADRTWNDLARAVIAALGMGRIEYIDFPEGLKDKYQLGTRADLTLLRSLGYDRDFVPLEGGVRKYVTTMDAEMAGFSP
ncbi:NAD-dependent epimerase/dehydratase family protein [bacterium]|nr:MAG: NAD-dependent epimerase/dehydratase family protein [bacterium]